VSGDMSRGGEKCPVTVYARRPTTWPLSYSLLDFQFVIWHRTGMGRH